MEGEDVFGSKISVYMHHPYQSSAASQMPNDFLVTYQQSKEIPGTACKRHFSPFPPPPNPAKVAPPRLLNIRPRFGEEGKETITGLDEFLTEMVNLSCNYFGFQT